MKTAKTKSEEPERAVSGEPENLRPDNGNNDLVELRRLIVQCDEVGDVLPDAIIQRTRRDDRLAKATLPIIEENIRQSVIRNPDVLADALFPAIGPAIRRAIAEALGQMVQSLNQTLENSVSPKGLRWRFEAWQTGKPFAEVVMLNSLIYRVEEVFLIHRETGGLLQHVSAQKNVSQDADMVSAMLTAIQDFAHDSFNDSENATLDSLTLNELSVWIERSPDAILAAVIRGNPPLALREIFKEAIEAIQFVQREDFENFDGDTTRFEKSRPMLDNCLQFQLSTSDEKKRILAPFNVLTGVTLFVLAVAGFVYIRDYWRWSNYLARLRAEPGIAVTESDLGWTKNSISGLRDPLAVNPEALLTEYSLNPLYIETDWKPYQDLSPQLVLARANRVLHPPGGITLSYENEVLRAEGKGPLEWFNEAEKISLGLAGVSRFILAPESLQSKIEAQHIYFNCATVDYTENQPAKIAQVRKDLEALAETGRNWQVEVVGQADFSGSAETNSVISQKRADKILAELLKSDKLRAVGQSLRAVGVSTDRDAECKVNFKVNLEKQ
jgi:outer membrane protein OmpA-like peptidoglycan-associated protein